ncbi:porin [Paraburkholderia sp.]|uniref:porin n=1 Tax=Paraburkholderia sp. TaxID=1926495 RepID=UPI0025E9E242|nr:porin [Paraburkholderia sp.]
MKKLLIATAALATFATAAHAQSSVTLYGTLDNAVAWFSNVKGANGSGNLVKMSAGNVSPNLWGLKGNEDLGNGLHAIFRIESGFDVNTGNSNQGGRLFGRQAYVGLQSNNMGTVTLGRQYDPLIDLIQPLTNDDVFASTFATPGDIDNYDNSFRTSNAIKYMSPDISGFKVSAMYGFGGAAGSMSAGQTYAAAVSYNNGPIGLAAGYFRATSGNGTVSSFDGLQSPTTGGVVDDSPGISGGFVSANSLQIVRAAGSYAIGPVTTGISYSNVQYQNYQTATSGSNNRTEFNTGQAYVNYQLLPAMVVGVGYNYTKGGGNGVDVTYNQVSLGAIYSLSKRTDIYALGGYQKASGNTFNTSGVLSTAVASMGDFGNDASNDRQGMVMVGIRHRF